MSDGPLGRHARPPFLGFLAGHAGRDFQGDPEAGRRDRSGPDLADLVLPRAKILLISSMPTASSMLTVSWGLAELGRGPLSPGNGDRDAGGAIGGRQRGDRVLLVGDAFLVVPGDHYVAPELGREPLLLGHPSLAGRRRERERGRAAQRLLANLLQGAGRVELLQGALGRPPDRKGRDGLGARGTGGSPQDQGNQQGDEALHESQRTTIRGPAREEPDRPRVQYNA